MIQWYPGHMAKAKRDMQKKLSLADVIIEVLDARAPRSTRNPDLDGLFIDKPRVVVLNKEDLAQPAATARWLAFFRVSGESAVPFRAIKGGSQSELMRSVEAVAESGMCLWAQKGANKAVRAMVAGIPNVGKSSVINALSGGKRANVGAEPGVTRGQQWVRISSRLELLDTPGVLWPKFEDQDTAVKLALIGAIRDEILEPVPLVHKLIEVLQIACPAAIVSRYKIDGAAGNPQDILQKIAKARGCLLRGGELDLERAADIVLNEFKQGRLGRITLEYPQEGEKDGSKGNREA